MVVASAEGREVAQTVKGDGVLGSGESESSGVSGDGARGHIVRGLATDKETISTDDGIGSESGTLEKIGSGSSVERGLLVDGSKDGSLLGFGRVERGSEVKLETLGDNVVDFDLGSEQVGGGPCLDS